MIPFYYSLPTHSKKLEVYDPGIFMFCCILSSVIDWLNDFTFFFNTSAIFLWQKNVRCCPPASSGTIDSTFPLLLIVLEGRVPFSASWLYQPQLWNPGSAPRTLLLKMGDGEMQITRERNVAVCITPNRPQGFQLVSRCNLMLCFFTPPPPSSSFLMQTLEDKVDLHWKWAERLILNKVLKKKIPVREASQ